jgi:hypothetical protein
MADYKESLSAPRWLLALLVLAALATLAAMVTVLLSDQPSALAKGALALVLGAAGLTMLLVVRSFSVLRVVVHEDSVRFGFGRLAVTLPGSRIVGAQPDRYPWLRYGGWGVRISTNGYRAYSQAFRRESVVIEAADHHRYHVSSSDPARLAEAINRVATAESASL